MERVMTRKRKVMMEPIMEETDDIDEKSIHVKTTTTTVKQEPTTVKQETTTIKQEPTIKPEITINPFAAAKIGYVTYFLSLSSKELHDTFSLRDEHGRTIFHVATSECYRHHQGHIKVLELLAKADTRKELINAKDNEGWAPAHYAAQCGRWGHEVLKILSEYEADFNLTNNCDRTALYYAATNGQPDTVRLLIELGANVNIQDKVGFAPLHRAAGKNFLYICNLLIRNGAKIDVLDHTEETPLVHAFVCGQKEASVYLIKRGADWTKLVEPDENGKTLLERAPEDLKDAIRRTVSELDAV